MLKKACFALWGAILVIFTTANVPSWGFTLEKSPLDTNKYDAFVLKNGMRVLVVSDSESNVAAAALSVGVGYFSDPPDLPGLAHFLEHNMFLGTKKYPNPDEYPAYISRRGGSYNAFTSSRKTTFFFTIEPNFLPGAIDRFSSMFTDPLFTKGYVDKELQAIEAEYSQNLNSDYHKIASVFRHVYSISTPLSQFGAGNRSTLQPVAILPERVKQFYQDHYSADLMSLVIIGKENTKTLRAMAEKYFSKVKKHPTPTLVLEPPFFQAKMVPSWFQVKTIKKMHLLSLTFPIPSQRTMDKEHTTEYLSNLLNSQIPGGLVDRLKQQDLLRSLDSGLGENHTEFSTFSADLELTDKGWQNQSYVIEQFFAALHLINQQKIEDWRITEQKKLAALGWKYKPHQDAQDMAINLAMVMRREFNPQLLFRDYDYSKFDAQNFNAILSSLTPQNMIVVSSGDDVPTDQHERYYDADYSYSPLSSADLAKFNHSLETGEMADLHLPGPNPYISDDLSSLTLIGPKITDVTPALLSQDNKLNFWFGPEGRFQIPRGELSLQLLLPAAYSSPKNSAMTKLWVKLWLKKLEPELYAARRVGYNYSITPTTKGLDIGINGYSSSKLVDLAVQLLTILPSTGIKPEQFTQAKQELQEDWENQRLASSSGIGSYEMTYLYNLPFWHRDAYLQTLPDVSIADLNSFAPQLFKAGKANVLLYGNFNEDEAKSLSEQLSQALFFPALSGPEPENAFAAIPAGDHSINILAKSKDSALVAVFQDSVRTEEDWAKLSLLERWASKAAFQELRTIQQLGYIVHSYSNSKNGVGQLSFLIQSPNHSPVEVKDRLDAFLPQFLTQIQSIKPADLEESKAALVQDLQKPALTQDEGNGRAWGELVDHNFNFDTRQKRVLAVKAVDLPGLIAFAQTLLQPATAHRQNMLVWDKDTTAGVAYSTFSERKDYKYSLGFYPEFAGQPQQIVPDASSAIVQSP